MAKPYWEQIDDIKKDLKKLSRQLAKNVSKIAQDNLIEMHHAIIAVYYGTYTPKYYRRHKRKNLYLSLGDTYLYNNKKDTWGAKVVIDSSLMGSHYGRYGRYKGVGAAEVLDMVWNNGIRGLPEHGSTPLTHDYTDPITGQFHKEGEIWENPYYMPLAHTPDSRMRQFIEKWGTLYGIRACNIAAKEIKNGNY